MKDKIITAAVAGGVGIGAGLAAGYKIGWGEKEKELESKKSAAQDLSESHEYEWDREQIKRVYDIAHHALEEEADEMDRDTRNSLKAVIMKANRAGPVAADPRGDGYAEIELTDRERLALYDHLTTF